ncbi:MAG: hypothetical protein ACTHJL_04885, partial [Amnibacterium sp.]
RKGGMPDRSRLPRETTLPGALLDKLDAVGHWNSWDGTVEQGRYRRDGAGLMHDPLRGASRTSPGREASPPSPSS